MDARAEQASLAADPLPPAVIIDPLTRVWDIDNQIAALNKQIELLTERRTEVMEYVLDNAIEEDSTCKLKVEKHISTPNRKIDAAKIRTDLPKVYERIWETKRSEAKAEFEKFGVKVEENKADLNLSQKLIEPALKAEGHTLEEVLIPGGLPKVSFTYSVVRK